MRLCVARAVVLSGSRLSYNDYDYTNSNTNVSSHLCECLSGADLATWQKKTKEKKGVSISH